MKTKPNIYFITRKYEYIFDGEIKKNTSEDISKTPACLQVEIFNEGNRNLNNNNNNNLFSYIVYNFHFF